jgi:dCTP deaminase
MSGVLSDADIRAELEVGKLRVMPMEDEQIQPASIDLRLSRDFSVLMTERGSRSAVSLYDKSEEWRVYHKENFVIHPKQFILASTMEYFNIPNNIAPFIEGRSSVGRKGLFIHNAGWVDPGFYGNITLELFNASDRPIMLEAGTRICQMVFMYTNKECLKPYEGKYSGQIGVTSSRMDEDREAHSL